MTKTCSSVRVARLGVWLAAGLASCSGPEPLATGPGPRVGGPGEWSSSANPPAPERTPAQELDQTLGLDALATAIAGAWQKDPAPVAVLPAFSDDPLAPRATRVFATGAGDWLAERVLAALPRAAADLEVWAPETVVMELERNNRSLHDVHATEDAVALVARTDAGYLVYGSLAKVEVGGKLTGKTSIRVRLTCVRLPSGEVVVSRAQAVERADLVQALKARLEDSSRILVGDRAAPFVPSLDRELELVTGRVLRRLLRLHRAELAGRRCAVAEIVADGEARRLATTVRGALRAALAGALPGKEAITVVDGSQTAEVELTPRFERGADRYALVLTLHHAGTREAVVARETIDPRFFLELRRALP